MAKFIAHGIILEEPTEKVVGVKLTPIRTIKIEEKQNLGTKEVATILTIEFAGKNADLIPMGRKIAGMVCVIWGNVTSREWQGKYFNDLRGDQFTLAEAKQTGYVVPPSDEPHVTQAGNIDAIEVSDDDLPF